MRYLSIDIEATGVSANDYIIEFGMIPFDVNTGILEQHLARNYYLHCPPFDFLRPNLNQWVLEHNEELIRKANKDGMSIENFENELQAYLETDDVVNYFANEKREKIILFGKSMNSIDLPFLTRDLGWEFMRKYFHHRVLDLSSIASSMVELNFLPEECYSGSGLMNHLEMGEVCHTALADAKNTAIMYLKLLEKNRR